MTYIKVATLMTWIKVAYKLKQLYVTFLPWNYSFLQVSEL